VNKFKNSFYIKLGKPAAIFLILQLAFFSNSFGQSINSFENEAIAAYTNDILQAEEQMKLFYNKFDYARVIQIGTKILRDAEEKEGVNFNALKIISRPTNLTFFDGSKKPKLDDVLGCFKPSGLKKEIIHRVQEQAKEYPASFEIIYVLKRVKFLFLSAMTNVYLNSRFSDRQIDLNFIKSGLADILNIPIFVKDAHSGMLLSVFAEEVFEDDGRFHLLTRDIIQFIKKNESNLGLVLSDFRTIDIELNSWKKNACDQIKDRLKLENSSLANLDKLVTL
jgi:hypothetical protein